MPRFSAPVTLFMAAALCTHAQAQTIPTKGTAETFDIATWNIEWFGSNGGPSNDEVQFAFVLSVMRQSGIDLWAVQEIADPDDFGALLDSLGEPYSGVLAEEGSQRIGFLYNTDLVSLRGHPKHILESFAYEFGTRAPLQLDADVTVGDSTRTLTFITIHMKCCGSDEEYDRREAAAGRLKNHIDFSVLRDDPVVILGDFNDELDDSITSGKDTPYRAFLEDEVNYRFITQPLDAGGLPTHCNNSSCSSGSTLDHILITNELFADVEAGTADRFLELTQVIPGYTQNTSDHLPVFARIRYGIRTGVDLPESNAFALGQPYPNPATDYVVLPVIGRETQMTAVRVEVYDVLGRRVLVQEVDDEIRLRTGHLPSGLYHVRVSNGPDSATLSFVIRR